VGVRDGVPDLSFKSFPAFQAGAAARAVMLGDVGTSAPDHWVGRFGSGDDHVLVTLYAADRHIRDEYSARLDALFAGRDAFQELWRADGEALTELRNGTAEYAAECRWVRGVPSVTPGFDRPGAAGQQGLWPLAQRRPAGTLTGDGLAAGGNRGRATQRLRVRQLRRVGRPVRVAHADRSRHSPSESARPADQGPGAAGRQQQRPPHHAARAP
jgi:hypothetical protein